MKNTDRLEITEISIKYFRSITSLTISANRLNMFVGLNDAGKSNVLKALNLFFNNETDYNEKFDFDRDFSLLFPKNSKKAKEIEVKITFSIPKNYAGDGKCIWRKRWRKNLPCKEEILSADETDLPAKSKIPNLLSKIVYRYVPAVKSKDYYKFLLIELYRAVSASVDSPLKQESNRFSQTLRDYTTNLSSSIMDSLKMRSELSLPDNFSEIFETLMFQTKKEGSEISVPLTLRGDGIQARHIPVILKYIADEEYNQSSRGAAKTNTIWGFEEPENGLELSMSFKMAKEFLDYSESIQIFMTTHSPAFYSHDKEEGVKVIFIAKNGESGSTFGMKNPDIRIIDENIGLMPFVTPYIAEKEAEIAEYKKLGSKEYFADKDTILVEGKTDKIYFEMAISELSAPLKDMIDNDELRIITKEEGGSGINLIKNWVIAWLYLKYKSKLMAIFDSDKAGLDAVNKLKNNSDYCNQGNSCRAKVINLKQTEEIKKLNMEKVTIPFEIEHLFGLPVWEKAIEQGFVEKRSYGERHTAFEKFCSPDRADNEVIAERCPKDEMTQIIVEYNPDSRNKMAFCKMVKNMKADGREGMFVGFSNTIKKIEDYFCKK